MIGASDEQVVEERTDDRHLAVGRVNRSTGDSIEGVGSLLEAPSPAVLTTYRQDGSAHVSPVWFRWSDGAFEVVIAKGDVKLRHLARDPRCVLVVFEAVRPFRGVEVRGVSDLVECDVSPVRADIAVRYLGVADGTRFAAQRSSKPGILLRLACDRPRVWDLSGILPE
jgi:PPOX class probable F420-dependent enzyme